MEKKKKENPMKGYDKTDRNFQRMDDESDVKGELGMREKTKPADNAKNIAEKTKRKGGPITKK
jgi:hypothetical protein